MTRRASDDFEYAVCLACGAPVLVRADGLIGPHNLGWRSGSGEQAARPRNDGRAWVPVRCAGSLSRPRRAQA